MKNDYIEIIKKRSYPLFLENKKELIKNIIYNDKLVTFINPYSYLKLRSNKEVFSQFDYIFSDGILLTKLINLSKIVITSRLSFDMTSLANVVFTICEKENLSVYLIGSKKVEINLALKMILQRFPKLNILDSRNGYFKNALEEKKVILNICKLKPRIVIVGMGSGLQEKFLVSLRKNGWNGTGFTCGGFFHQVSKNIDYYPKLINKFNLRAIYRIKKEPKLVLRYFFIYPVSLCFFTYDIFHYLFFKTIKR